MADCIKRFDLLLNSFAGQCPHDPAQGLALRIFLGGGGKTQKAKNFKTLPSKREAMPLVLHFTRNYIFKYPDLA